MQKVLFILRELEDSDVDWLIQTGQRQQVTPGTVLIHEGQPVDTLYILLAGALVVSISALEGRQIARLSTGEVVGEMSFIDSHPPSATVQTLEESVVLAISRKQLAEKLRQDVGFAARFYRALAILLSHRLRGTVKQLGENREEGVASRQDGNRDEAIAQARFERLLDRLNANP
jgi:bacteriocin-type transport-associated protein